MDLKIDSSSHVPIYLQIAEGFRLAVNAGVLKPNEAIPSLRSLGVELLVNPNTVQRAYDELERQGVIYCRRGVGMFVAARPAARSGARRDDEVADAFRRAVDLARSAKMTTKRIRHVFEQSLKPTEPIVKADHDR